MKLLLCPKGHTGASVLGKLIHFEYYDVGDDRRYAFVTDDVAAELLKQNGYDVVDLESCPPELLKKFREANPDTPAKDAPAQNAISNYESSTPNVPTPVFIPTIWTDDTESNYPVKIVYSDVQGNTNAFVFTKDYILRPCWLCRIRNWIRHTVFRKGLKSS